MNSQNFSISKKFPWISPQEIFWNLRHMSSSARRFQEAARKDFRLSREATIHQLTHSSTNRDLLRVLPPLSSTFTSFRLISSLYYQKSVPTIFCETILGFQNWCDSPWKPLRNFAVGTPEVLTIIIQKRATDTLRNTLQGPLEIPCETPPIPPKKKKKKNTLCGAPKKLL